MVNRKTLIFLSLVMLINAISYGTIIPLIYPYGHRFGIGPLQLSWLLTSFSLAQFLATPIISRLSDRYGRKPLLLFSVLGSALSLILFASARTTLILFIARIIDGLTGGNFSVAQAVIADSTKEGQERTKSFGILGAIFGFGFLIGPALGGLLSKIALTTPFWFAAVLSLIAVIFGLIYLPETNKTKKVAVKEPLFRFSTLLSVLSTPYVGILLLITFIVNLANNSWIIGFQTFTVDILKLDTTSIGLLFAISGVISIIMQVFGLRLLLEKFTQRAKLLRLSLILSGAVMLLLALTHNLPQFMLGIIAFGIVSSPFAPVIGSLITEYTKAEDQGGIMGVNQSYSSLGMIIGPLLAGVVAKQSVHAVFLMTGAIILLGAGITTKLQEKRIKAVDL